MSFARREQDKKPTILLVDDEPNMLTSNKMMLERLTGFHVIAVNDMADLRDVFAAHPIEAVVTDFNMGVQNGDGVVAMCREITGNPKFPAFILSANREEVKTALKSREITDVEVHDKLPVRPSLEKISDKLKTLLSKGAGDLPPH